VIVSLKGAKVNQQLSLRDWLKASPFKGSVTSLASFLNIPPKTVEDWVYGRYRPSPRSKMRLFLLTGLSCYEPSSLAERQALHEVRAEQDGESDQMIQRLLNSLDNVMSELDFFRYCTATEREKLRKRLDGRHIAYISNLLQLLLNEERFQTWLEMDHLNIPLGGRARRHD